MLKSRHFALLGVTMVVGSSMILAPLSAQQPGKGNSETVVVDESVTINWIRRSNVAALREGVIDTMELKVGDPVLKGGTIGKLHDEIAQLTASKAKLQSEATGQIAEATARKELAGTVVALNRRLNETRPGMVSKEEVAKAEAEFKVAHAQVTSAQEKQAIETAELNLANRMVKEHTIVAPFDGVIIERMKHEGESVRANEPVVELGDLSRLRAEFYIQLQSVPKVKVGQRVEFTPRSYENGRQVAHTAETRKFVGYITMVDSVIQPVAETAKRIFAEFDNKDHALEKGMTGVLVIYVNEPATGDPTLKRTARSSPAGLPTLPK